MSIKSILCAYSGDPEKGNGLRHAIRLAQQHEAYLTGVAKTNGIGFMHRQLHAQIPEQVRAQLDENGRRIMAATKARFLKLVEAEGLLPRAEFLELDPRQNGPIASFARAFDLVVIGHHSGTTNEDDFASHPDLIALRSGRPVLIVPDGYEAPDYSASRILVAWDGKRAATHAIAAAMPLFEQGATVTLLSVGQTPRNTDQLLKSMNRQGVSVSALSVEQRGSIADVIVAHAAETKAELIVMGAFEHSKFSNDIVGGATTDVLKASPVPVFMAH